MSYLWLYYLHVGAVVLSGSFFVIRGCWMLLESPLLEARFTRIFPHVVDTVLLTAAIGLIVITHQNPWHHTWLAAKILALLVYIGFGMMALRRAPTRRLRAVFFGLATLTFLYMVSVALTRDPLGILSGLSI